MDRICYIFGERQIPMDIARRSFEALSQVVQLGIRTFVMWPSGGLEELAADMLHSMKQTTPGLRLLCLTCDPNAPVPPGFDGTHRPKGLGQVPKRFKQTHCSRMMAEQCHHAICYVTSKGSPLILQGILHRRDIPVIQLHDTPHLP